MSVRSSRDTVITNIVQQTTAIAAFLVVPKFLSVEDYAEVTYAKVLLSFIVFSDFGIASVYTRKMPAIYNEGMETAIESWNQTIFWTRLVLSAVFGAIISGVYFLKYGNGINALVFLGYAPLWAIVNFHIARNVAGFDFSVYRQINSFNAWAKLLVVPFVMLAGLLGWFWSQTLSYLLTFWRIKGRIFLAREKIDLGIVRSYWLEGLLQVTITVLWLQTINSGRFFSSFYFADKQIAQYGLATTGYGILSSLIIAAFLPRSVHVLRQIKEDEFAAVRYTFDGVLYALPIIFILCAGAVYCGHEAFQLVFPEYGIERRILKAMFISLLPYPLVLTLGNLFIAKKKFVIYIVTLVGAFGVAWGAFLIWNQHLADYSAVLAQNLAILLLAVGQSIWVFCNYRQDLKRIWARVAVAYALFAGSYILVLL